MIVIIIYMVISFFLDGIVSNYIGFELMNISYLKTIYSLVALIISYNYFDNHKKYIYILVILGILFDIVYTNTFILNVFIFLIIYFILDKLDYLIPNNMFTINIKSLICMYVYHIMTYIILLMSHYNEYSIEILRDILIRSSIMTIIYTLLSYILLSKIYKKYYDRKIK